MEDIATPANEVALTDKDIFRRIWTTPRLVFRFLNEYEYDNHVRILLVLSGVANALGSASSRNLGSKMSLTGVLVSCVLGGVIFNWITYYIYAALISWTGGRLKARGGIDAIVRVLAYSSIPTAVSLLFVIPQIAIYGNEVFKSHGNMTSAGLMPNIFVWASVFIEGILGLWSIVLCVIGISEVQGLSIGKAILNMLIPIAILVVAILLIVAVIYLIH